MYSNSKVHSIERHRVKKGQDYYWTCLGDHVILVRGIITNLQNLMGGRGVFHRIQVHSIALSNTHPHTCIFVNLYLFLYMGYKRSAITYTMICMETNKSDL